MFCDLVGSTSISAGLDAEEWRDLVGAYLDAASTAVTEMGGHVAKKLGDGLMALFGYPVAQENDAERAARAALSIQRALAEVNRKNAGAGKPELNARIGIETGPVVVDDAHCRNFLAHSPFAVIGSTRPGRGTDVSPRGDAPGFARVLDDRTIAIPDRPGNNRLDTMSNIVADADVGLLFFIPGIDETLRINGMARLSREPELLAAAAINGREPRLIILVTVREAFLHCGKALKRSRLWQDDYRVDKRSFPSLGRMIVEQTSRPL